MTTMISVNEKEMFTVKELAEYLSIHERHVYYLIKKKKIPATRITGKWLFPKNLIKEWIVSNALENVGDITYPESLWKILKENGVVPKNIQGYDIITTYMNGCRSRGFQLLFPKYV